ncbi:MAG TPA: hypothetical protein VEK86_04095 [Gemmatimonadales bacterium]|nr:hypothetical protein [Gemmatimonadales bacterium]
MKTAVAIGSAFVPALALACPACARDQGPYAALFIGAMIAAPYVVVAVVVRAIRSWGDER